jgi:hypothetical protein
MVDFLKTDNSLVGVRLSLPAALDFCSSCNLVQGPHPSRQYAVDSSVRVDVAAAISAVSPTSINESRVRMRCRIQPCSGRE